MIAIAYYSKETTIGFGIVKFTKTPRVTYKANNELTMNQKAQFFYFNQTSCQEQEEEEQRNTFT